MTGMDWGETLGVMYHLRSSKYGHDLALRVETENRENPNCRVSDIWATANLNEREVFDFYGIRFINHPDMAGYSCGTTGSVIRCVKITMRTKRSTPSVWKVKAARMQPPTLELTKEGTIEERENVIFEDDEYVVNIGPQHPATWSAPFQVSLEGEIVKSGCQLWIYPPGNRKCVKPSPIPQTLALTDRLDYLSAHMNRHALCMCIEEAMGLEIPERAKYIRTIMDELTRIASSSSVLVHLLYGPGSPDRFLSMDSATGKDPGHVRRNLWGRLIQNYNCIGGVMADIHPNLITRIKDFIRYLPLC